MTDSLSDAAHALRESSSRLNAITDEATKCVRNVEEFLEKECSIGIPTFVEIATDPEAECVQCLDYRRIGNRFRIAIRWSWYADHEETIKPWSDCNRDQKLEALKFLPRLLMELTKQIDLRIAEAEATMADISEVLKPLTGKGN